MELIKKKLTRVGTDGMGNYLVPIWSDGNWLKVEISQVGIDFGEIWLIINCIVALGIDSGCKWLLVITEHK